METNNNLGDIFKPMELHEKIKAERLKRGMSQADVGKLVGISQPAVKKIEAGTTVRSRYAEEIARKLGIWALVPLTHEDGNMTPENDEGRQSGQRKPEPEFFGPRDLPVFSAVEGGPGEMVVSTDPIDLVPRPWFLARVKDAYAVLVTGESMQPVYDPGDMVLINPKLPPQKGKDAIFVAGEAVGDFRASIKRFMGATDVHWLAKQFNPPDGQKADLKLDRKEWERALRVVGRYTG